MRISGRFHTSRIFAPVVLIVPTVCTPQIFARRFVALLIVVPTAARPHRPNFDGITGEAAHVLPVVLVMAAGTSTPDRHQIKGYCMKYKKVVYFVDSSN
jgi:hypothetical protein